MKKALLAIDNVLNVIANIILYTIAVSIVGYCLACFVLFLGKFYGAI